MEDYEGWSLISGITSWQPNLEEILAHAYTIWYILACSFLLTSQ